MEITLLIMKNYGNTVLWNCVFEFLWESCYPKSTPVFCNEPPQVAACDGYTGILTLVLLSLDFSIFENTVDPDQLASDEAI